MERIFPISKSTVLPVSFKSAWSTIGHYEKYIGEDSATYPRLLPDFSHREKFAKIAPINNVNWSGFFHVTPSKC
jgi:hypothetical protein